MAHGCGPVQSVLAGPVRQFLRRWQAYFVLGFQCTFKPQENDCLHIWRMPAARDLPDLDGSILLDLRPESVADLRLTDHSFALSLLAAFVVDGSCR